MPGLPGGTMHESSRAEWPSILWKRSFHSNRAETKIVMKKDPLQEYGRDPFFVL